MEVATAVATAPVPMPKPTPRYRLRVSDLVLSVHANTEYVAKIPAGTPLDEVLKPEYWASVAPTRNWEFGDTISLKPYDGRYWAKLLVLDAGPSWLKVQVIQFVEVEPAERGEENDFPGYRIEWQNITTKFAIIRESDKEVLRSGFKTKHSAGTWLIEHMKAMSR